MTFCPVCALWLFCSDLPASLISCCAPLCLRAAVAVAVRRRLAGRVRGFLKATRGIRQVLPLLALTLLLAPQLLELARGFLEFVRERPLRIPGRGATLLLTASCLLLGLLQLSSRELLQPFRKLVNLLRLRLLLRSLLCFVLVRLAIELQLEQVRELFSHLLATAAPAAATLLLLAAHFELVRLLGILQVLERALFGRERFLRFLRLQQLLGRLSSPAAAFGSASMMCWMFSPPWAPMRCSSAAAGPALPRESSTARAARTPCLP